MSVIFHRRLELAGVIRAKVGCRSLLPECCCPPNDFKCDSPLGGTKLCWILYGEFRQRDSSRLQSTAGRHTIGQAYLKQEFADPAVAEGLQHMRTGNDSVAGVHGWRGPALNPNIDASCSALLDNVNAAARDSRRSDPRTLPKVTAPLNQPAFRELTTHATNCLNRRAFGSTEDHIVNGHKCSVAV
jgi:hypothetical protein